MNRSKRSSAVLRVMAFGMLCNLLLFMGKLFAGLMGHSAALVSDAIHSASDLFSSLLLIIGVFIARAAGAYYERIEAILAIIVGCILSLSGLFIGYNAITAIFGGSGEALEIPTVLPLIAATVAIAAKEGLYHFVMHRAESLDSALLRADAWHHRSDVLASVGSLIGVAGARMGMPILDRAASLVISFLILKAAYGIIVNSSRQLLRAISMSGH